MNTTIESKRWRFQYTLRSLLILMFVVCLGMSWVAVRMRKADRQRKAVEFIRKFGGLVYYEHAFDDLKHVRHRPQPPIPRFVQDLLGDDFFADVLYIDLGPTKVSDADLECLETLDRLEWLVLSDTEITDAGLAHLRPLRQLKDLYLKGTKVTDAGMRFLAGKEKLRVLDLSWTSLTDQGLKELHGLDHLDWLLLGSTQITDAGLVHLKEFPNLRVLNLGGAITEAGLEHLKDIPRLEYLGVWCSIADEGLRRLEHLRHLKTLRCFDPEEFTPAARKRFKNALPHCEIEGLYPP